VSVSTEGTSSSCDGCGRWSPIDCSTSSVSRLWCSRNWRPWPRRCETASFPLLSQLTDFLKRSWAAANLRS